FSWAAFSLGMPISMDLSEFLIISGASFVYRPVCLAISDMLALPIVYYFNGEFPFITLSYFNMNQCKFFGNISRNSFSPFDPAIVPAIKIVFNPEIQGFFRFVYPVKVKMIHRITIFPSVFIDDGKSWTGYYLFHLKLSRDFFYQRGLSRSHTPVE